MVSQRPDGYHNLETVFYPVPLTDALEMAETGETGISFSGFPVDSPSNENLVIKAYQLLKKDYDLPPVQFHLHKVIPSGAGLGGGSSDAAFTLKMLNRYFELQLSADKLREYAAKLGADCPFFIENKPAFATGTGNQLIPIGLDLSDFRIVVLKPGVSVSTVQAYKNVVPSNPDFNLLGLPGLPVEKWKNTVVNDFEKSVFPSNPEIEEFRNKLYEMGAVYASMSGSGSAVFGLFRHLPANFDKYIPGGVLFSR